MVEQTDSSPRKKNDECSDDNLRINSMFSIETIDSESTVRNTKSQIIFPKGDLISMENTIESVSAFADANTSDNNNTLQSIVMASGQCSGSSGPPINIIQQLDNNSAPLINFDSIQDSERESDASDFNGRNTKGDDDKTSWLNIDSSSTSQGSQGSYAHQVPALLGSYGSNGIQAKENLLPPLIPSRKNTMSDQYQSAHSRSSHFRNLEAPQNSNLDDILGPKGEPVQFLDGEPLQSDLDDILGPQSDGKPSDLDDTLGPYEVSTEGLSGVPSSGDIPIQSEKADYNSEYVHFRSTDKKDGEGVINVATPEVNNQATPRAEASNASSSIPKDANDVISTAVISEKQEPQEKNPKIKSMQQLYQKAEPRDESKSTLESKGTGYSQETKSSVGFTSESSHGETTDRGDDSATQDDFTLSTDNHTSTWDSSRRTTQEDTTLGTNNYTSTWDSSLNGTFSPNSYSQRTGTFSPNSYSQRSGTFSPSSYSKNGGTFSPNSYSQKDMSTNVGNTISGSPSNTCSTQGNAMLSLDSAEISAVSQGNSRSRIDQYPSEEYSQFSPTRHSQLSHSENTRSGSTQYISAISTNDTGSRHQIDQLVAVETSQLSPTKHSQSSGTERTERTFVTAVGSITSTNMCSTDNLEVYDESQGGRMWREAQLQADSSKNKALSPRAKKFAESIMARTRSRANPDALLDNSSNNLATEKPTRSMINVNSQEEGGFVESTAIARKRGRVVQLLTVGLLSFLIAFLGGFLVLSSCHFVSATILVGENAEEFDLHFGLWKYSPADSASQGYTYCSNYDGDFIGSAPWFGRISSLVALLGGAFSLGVLWFYLVLGRCVDNIWNIAVYAAALSGVLQLSTLSVLASTICNKNDCALGPAGIISVAAGCFYFVLAFEMHYNTPLANASDNSMHNSSREELHHVVANLEMTDFEYGAKAYVRRLTFGNSNPYPTLDQSQISNHNNVGEIIKDRKNPSYEPPIALV